MAGLFADVGGVGNAPLVQGGLHFSPGIGSIAAAGHFIDNY